MNNEKNETQYSKAREVVGYVDYRNHLLFLEECDLDFEMQAFQPAHSNLKIVKT